MKTNYTHQVISAHAIALRIGRTNRGVLLALRRLKIKPVIALPGKSYYHPDVAEQLRAAMRKPNRSPEV